MRRAYEELYSEILAILHGTDPVGIILNQGARAQSDEYSPEVSTILPRLRTARDEEDVAEIMHQEFQHWFGDRTAGSRERYRRVAPAVWAAWRRFQARVRDAST